MASSPDWKVYDSMKVYQGCAKEPEAAAVMAEWYGDGSTVRYGHKRIVWTHGVDELGSWDSFIDVIDERVNAKN